MSAVPPRRFTAPAAEPPGFRPTVRVYGKLHDRSPGGIVKVPAAGDVFPGRVWPNIVSDKVQ